ncbi:MAG: hypothetical protein II248_05695 [Paludibacteraceae bacterium]|nr:hypothetical protein [Paludibacteraceae bacterium]
MKLQQYILLGLLVNLTSCWTLIATVVPDKPVVPTQTVYTTHVTTPTPKYVSTTTTLTVTSYSTDLSFYLDLQAVAAAFAEARSVQEFENLLNSSRYMINNLDLNGDGYIDYLRVLETRQGYYHALLIQACVAPSLFQDVATLVAERRSNALYVEVIGDPYLYGPNYIVRPVFVNRPPLWDAFGRPSYKPWCSPYHHGHWPSHYQRTKPVYLSHYQAYVNTYMKNHHYCHVCDYPSHIFYKDYHVMVKPHCRNDYRDQHPDKSFERRVNPNATSRNTYNARDLRNNTQSKQTTSETKNTTIETTPTRTGQTTTTPSRTGQTTTTPSRTGQTTTPTRTSQTTTSTKTNSNTSRTSSTTVKEGTPTRVSTTVKTTTPSTTVETKVNKSGTTRTTVKTTNTTKSTSVTTPNTTRNTRTTTTASPANRTTTNTQPSRNSRTSGAGTR